MIIRMNTVLFSFFILNDWHFKQATHPILRILVVCLLLLFFCFVLFVVLLFFKERKLNWHSKSSNEYPQHTFLWRTGRKIIS